MAVGEYGGRKNRARYSPMDLNDDGAMEREGVKRGVQVMADAQIELYPVTFYVLQQVFRAARGY